MWFKIAHVILRNRLLLLSMIGLITLFMGYKALKVELATNFTKLIPEDNPKYIKYQQFKNTFGDDGGIIVTGIQTKKMFELDFFRNWAELGQKIEKVKGVKEIISINTLFNIHKNEDLKKFEFVRLFSKTPQKQQELDSLKRVFYNLPFYENLIYNKATDTYLLLIMLDHKTLYSKDRLLAVKEVIALFDNFSAEHNTEAHFSGLPYLRTIMATKVAKELELFSILSMLFTALVLYLIFRSFQMVIFPMLIVIIGIVWSLGSITLMNYQITLLTGLIPPLMVVIGIPNCIYLLNRYHSEFNQHGNKMKALYRVIGRIGVATFFTNLTTAIGCGSFIFSNSPPLKEFGIIASMNIMSLFLVSLIVIPIVFGFLPPPKPTQIKYLSGGMMDKLMNSIEVAIKFHRNKIVAATLLVLLIAFTGTGLLKTTGYIMDDLSRNSTEYKDLKFFEKEFKGIMPFEIILESANNEKIMKYDMLSSIDKIQNVITEFPQFSKPVSLAEGVKFAKQAFYNGNPKAYRSVNLNEVQKIQSYMDGDVNNNALFNKFVDSTGNSTRISTSVADISSADLPLLLKELEDKIYQSIDKDKYKVSFTGASVISLEGNRYLVNSLTGSLVLAFSLIVACLCVLFGFRSYVVVFAAIISNLIPLCITAGVMGYAGIPLKPSTVLVFSLSLGIVVDTSIHFLTKYQQELIKHGGKFSKAISITLHETGKSMIYSSFILFFGFSIFNLSGFGGTVALGALTSITIIAGLFSNLMVLPTLLLIFSSRTKRTSSSLFIQTKKKKVKEITI